ncbi:Rho GTPase activation protein [Penicillium hispanicum]|uniref:Rho GTPase activation protein n=1 Tax=Penicillium hispanicum TaxID=1080232 RepID=UPI002541DB24|nr:Rho GTPase activation protein [Penicillium hispanicum]KAJ5587447.1 Rho GTPase activation protein [Penicillium hispanicum]
MPSLLALFRSSKPADRSARSRSRRTWPRLRRSPSATIPLAQHPEPTAADEDPKEPQAELHPDLDGATDVASVQDEVQAVQAVHQEVFLQNEAPMPAPAPAPEEMEPPVRKSNGGSDHSQSQHGSHHGSKRLKGIMARFRLNKSQDRSSVSEILHHPELQYPKEPEVTTDPVKKDSTSQSPVVLDHDAPEQNRSVSTQTAQSQESSHTNVTVCRHPSQSIQMPIAEAQEEWLWPNLINLSQDTAHLLEASDPFSDGKGTENRRQQASSSKYSEDRIQGQSEASAAPTQAESEQQPASKSHSSSRQVSFLLRNSRSSSSSSHASRGGRMSWLDPSKATMAFNMLAAQLNLQMSIPVDDSVTARSDDRPLSGEDGSASRRRHRLIGRVRPVQSNLTLGEASHTPISKLRRTKTFASLSRRPGPMCALRGRSVETLARLGGQSFLLLPTDLAPAPLQLPACIVATVMYLRKFASSSAELFVEPGDVKAASQLYDHFAEQVLTAEKDESKIAMTMRVIAMPHWEANSDPGKAPVLSAGWVLKTLLAGLPAGILGSDHLYQTLAAIYRAAPADSARTRLLTLAIVALTSEMQCGLICAVFGLLTGLLQDAARPPHEDQTAGSSVRPVAGMVNADGLARVFGPLLLGTGGGQQDRDSPAQQQVEREIEEQRVAGLLLENWRSVSRQLREWMRGSSHTAKRE